MTTQWIRPKSVYQFAEDGGEGVHVPWDFDSITHTGILPIKLKGTLQHVARSPKPDRVNKTYFIRFSNFAIESPPETITGIEIRLHASRHGRITDDTIQLVSSSGAVSDNQATLLIENSKIYNFPPQMTTVFDENFGVEFRFRSHPSWPHNETIVINSVELRLY